MGTWMNSDGLFVRLGADEGDISKGGQVLTDGDIHIVEFDVDYTDLLSATPAILGSAAAGNDGSFGVVLPEGARIKAVETLVLTAFTSSGTVGSATFVMGLKKDSDRSTELDHDGLTAAGVVGSTLDAAGERNYITIGSTGVGALIGTTLAESGVIVVSNSAHGSHPYTAGKVRVRVEFFYV